MSGVSRSPKVVAIGTWGAGQDGVAANRQQRMPSVVPGALPRGDGRAGAPGAISGCEAANERGAHILMKMTEVETVNYNHQR